MVLALAAVLLWTNPSTTQLVTVDRSLGSDSVKVECSGGPAMHSLEAVEVWWVPVTGGGWRKIAERNGVGLEGRPDSLVFDQGPGGHAYVVARNNAGRSCASGVVYVSGSITTGIDPGPPPDRIVESTTFDVRGRRVTAPLASGVYFRRDRYTSGRLEVRRVVLVK